MELQQRPELRQKVTLSPQVYQGLSILAMPIADLQQMIEVEMLENPVLEVDETELEPVEGEEAPEEAGEDDREWDEWLEMYEDLEQIETTGPRDPNAEEPNTEEFVGGVQTFDDYLLGQVGLLDVEPEVQRAAAAIIGSLDSDGFFVGSLDEIARVAGVTSVQAAEGLEVVQQLDPPGVGARDLVEALCLQMESLGLDEPMLLRIVRDHLDDVAANHYRKVARALRLDEGEVRRLVQVLKSLNPRPAGAFSPGPSPGYIVPDVTVRRFEGEDWLLIPNNESLPTLRVSPRYRAMLKKGATTDDETKRYLKDKIRSAESFIRNVDRRKDTVSRITQIILEVQRDFFEDGKGPLRPLRLEDVAVELGVHLSTVSRGVTGKYMATPYGLFELKHFFSGGYRTAQGMDVAATSIKQRLRELVKEEDAVKPLSDQKLAELLSEEGVTVARRTVAKYREELGIEPSWARRRR
ncbi:MAG: RNA polymerase factor sigma-54 [Coriobacteriales bacterium]|nr:RNA polymerase factor sigma-54 [Coriobacteriales bacterium]